MMTADYSIGKSIQFYRYHRHEHKKEALGVDIFIHHKGTDSQFFGDNFAKAGTDKLQLHMIINCGVKVWPDGFDQTSCTDHWRSS